MLRKSAQLASALLMVVSATASAQYREGETRVSLVVSPTRLGFSGAYGGAQSALSAELRVTRYFNRTVGGELSAFALLPGGVASVQPGCTPGSVCEERTSPDMIRGMMASGLFAIGETGLRASLGGGAVVADGVQGPSKHSSPVVSGGVEWVPDGTSKFTPSFGLRVVHMFEPIAGTRSILLPGVGMSF